MFHNTKYVVGMKLADVFWYLIMNLLRDSFEIYCFDVDFIKITIGFIWFVGIYVENVMYFI